MKFIRDYMARRQIRKMAGAYLSVEKLEQMVSGKQTVDGPTEEVLTAFFGSIHGYVGLAEELPLARLRELINAYYGACGEAIADAGGTVDKFIGDGVVAMFGAPHIMSDHAAKACIAALKLQGLVAQLRERLRREGDKWPAATRRLRMRIGLNTGRILVGNLGTKTRFSYAMMGEEVNVAARLEQAAKEWGVWTLCTAETKTAGEETHPGHVVLRSLGETVVKGRLQKVELFEPLALAEEADDRLHECVGLFEQGLKRYQGRDWDGALECFGRSATLEPNQPDAAQGITTNPSLVFTERARAQRQGGPT